jgi:hypothetical protein|nr:DUF5688 family protein [uncultured Acetatifactor sp.]
MREKLVEEIKKAVYRQYGDDYEVQFYETTDPGGSSFPTVVIRTPGENTCPAIRIDHLLSKMRCGFADMKEAAAEFMTFYNKIYDISQYTKCIPHIDREYILNTVTYRLVNTEKEAPRLGRLPHRELLDLSVIYSIPIDIGKTRDEYIIVDNALCERLSISPDELQESAELHTELQGFRITPYTPCPTAVPDAETGGNGLWVLTSKNGINGAVVLLYPYYLRKLSGRLKKDLYLVASSKDRVIAAPAEKGTDLQTLRDTADRINSSHVPRQSLTSTIYRFRRRGGKLETVPEQKGSDPH